jgi:uncharacterized membrane protein
MRNVGRTILTGLLAILPIGLTIYVVSWMAVGGEALMRRLLGPVLPESIYLPGLGLVVALVVLYAVGVAVNAWAVKQVLRASDTLFSRIPLVKTLYVAIRDFTRFFPADGASSDLKHVVLVTIGPGKLIGFITAEDGSLIGAGDDVVAVYVPMSYTVGGYTVFMPRSQLEPTSLSVEAAMRVVLMAGMQSTATATTSSPARRPTG